MVLLAASVLAGCSNPDAPSHTRTTETSIQNQGEPPAPNPPSASSQHPAEVISNPQAALAQFTHLYTNWTYRTLTANQHSLARIAVGSARLAEQQAAAASQADTTIKAGRIWNTAQVISIATDLTTPGVWTIVTREETGGSSQYEGLPATYHVTLAKLARLPDGYAVSEWLPQS
jgi:hypothetical protein